MNFDLTRPCSKCPFRTDCLKGWLGFDRAREIAEGLLSGATFTCHETTAHEDEDGDCAPTGEEQHCAGALIFLEKMERPNQLMRIAERLGDYDRSKLDMDASVFKRPGDFLAHHTDPARRKKRSRP